PLLPTRHGLERSRLPLISRWKILDNLRRSLVAPALIALLASAWTWLPGSPLGWTLAALAVLGFPLLPPLVHLAGGPRPQQPDRPLLPTRHGLDRSRLPLISRWKILDNLRRSLVAPALIALLASAWTWLPGSPLGWTLAALAVLGFPLLPPLVHLAGGPRPQQPFGVYLRDVGAELKTAGAQVLLQIMLLASHAYEMVPAI